MSGVGRVWSTRVRLRWALFVSVAALRSCQAMCAARFCHTRPAPPSKPSKDSIFQSRGEEVAPLNRSVTRLRPGQHGSALVEACAIAP